MKTLLGEVKQESPKWKIPSNRHAPINPVFESYRQRGSGVLHDYIMSLGSTWDL